MSRFVGSSRLVVGLWLAAGLVWRGANIALEPPEVLATARIQPLAEEPPAPETPEPEPAAPPAPPSHAPEPTPEENGESAPEPAAPTPLGLTEIARGDAILDAGGAFPALSCSYEDFASFRDYARAMTSLGARFVVVERGRILASVDLASGAIGDADIGPTFSPRARDYTGEPDLAALARTARQRFGGDAVVMMLVPRVVDAGLFGGIARALSERGEHHDGFREIRGRYERTAGGGVRLRVDAAVRGDGDELDLELLFDLDQIAGLGVAPA